MKNSNRIGAKWMALGLAIIGLAGCQQAPPPLILWDNGVSEYQIVVPQPGESAVVDRLLREAAGVLREAFAASGVEVEIFTEGEHDPGRPGIFLGNTEFARQAGLDVGNFEAWEFAIRAVGPNLLMAGNDQQHPFGATDPHGREMGAKVPSVRALTEFLHRFAGTRFLYPGAAGIQFAALPQLSLPGDLDLHIVPRLRFVFGGSHSSTYHAATQLLGRGDLYLIANNLVPSTDFDPRQVHSWCAAMPVDEFAETNPEYFALINGVRTVLDPARTSMSARRAYNLGHPEVRENIYRLAVDSLDLGFPLVCVGQQDAFMPCESEESRALYGTGDNWREKIWLFNREVAERLLEDRPEARVVFLAYDATWHPPESFRTLPPNAIVLLSRTDPETLAEWRQLEVPGGFGAYLYNWGTYSLPGYMPKVAPEYVAAQVRELDQMNVLGLYLDGFGHSYGLEGPVYYVFGRMWDDPQNLDAADLVAEFCDAAFGPASAAMQEFYQLLYAPLAAYRQTFESLGTFQARMRYFADASRSFAAMYPLETIQALDDLLVRAEALAATEQEQTRLALVRLEFDYLQHKARVANLDVEFRADPTHPRRERLLEAVDAWTAYLDRLYDGRETPRAIPGLSQPFSGHVRRIVGLSVNHGYRSYADSPLNWDTAAVRASPLAELQRLTAGRLEGRPEPGSPQWEQFPAGTVGSAALRVARNDMGLLVRFELPAGSSGAERLEVVVAPDGGPEKTFRFALRADGSDQQQWAKGLITDGLDPRFGREDATWAGPWDAIASLAPNGNRYCVLFIPFATLGVPAPAATAVWPANFLVASGGEEIIWAAPPQGDTGPAAPLAPHGRLQFD